MKRLWFANYVGLRHSLLGWCTTSLTIRYLVFGFFVARPRCFASYLQEKSRPKICGGTRLRTATLCVARMASKLQNLSRLHQRQLAGEERIYPWT